MKTLNRNEIHPVKMVVKVPDVIVNAGMRVINSDGFIYEYVGIGWIKLEKAEKKDYIEIPQLID